MKAETAQKGRYNQAQHRLLSPISLQQGAIGMDELTSIEAFRDELTEVARRFTRGSASVEDTSDLVIWLAFALLDRERRAWTDEQRATILRCCRKEMEMRLKYGRWSEEWLGWS